MTDKESEEETKIGSVIPALEKSGWSYNNKNMRLERLIRKDEQFTDGKVILQSKENKIKRGNPKKADIVLYQRNNYPLAIIEVESSKHTVDYGLQQAMNYAKMNDVRFAYSTNGKGFVEYDFKTGQTRKFDMDSFPSCEELYEKYCSGENLTNEQKRITEQRYYFKEGLKTPRYYQRIAINRTVEYVSKLKDNPDMKRRALLVMATGTGKTYTAFQIIYRLYEANVVKKVLYLGDRNFLIDQTIDREFQSFKERGILTKVTNKTLDSAYDIYMSLYQQLSGDDNLEPFRQFSPDFFDLIIVDECHRGSARENSKWRDVLDYFSGAIHIGMTATPKETEDVSNSNYFGEPLYTYSLKQGINDGFLAPYTVRRIYLDNDVEGYTPEQGKLDDNGNPIEQKQYTSHDFDRNIVLEKRSEQVAKRITEYLKVNDRYAKTIVFCVDTEHAERMADLLRNENADMCQIDYRYVMQITGNNVEGKAQLENFLNDDSRYPTIVTTSQLLSTGLDCRMCKVIVFDKEVNSMTDFKQIIGRGTRLVWDKGKRFFTILDFRGVTKKFSDPEFDGPATSVFIGPKQPITPVFPDYDDDIVEEDVEVEGEPRIKYHVSDVSSNIVAEQELTYGPNGQLISNQTEHFKKLLLEKYPTINDFKKAWNETNKEEFLSSFLEQGVDISRLKYIYDREIDIYDIMLRIAYGKDMMIPKAERVETVKNSHFYEELEDNQKQIVDELLDIYVEDDDDVVSFENDVEIFSLPRFRQYGGLTSIIKKRFGNKTNYLDMRNKLINALYESEGEI